MIPRPGEWTLTLNENPDIFHFLKPDSADDQIHVAVTPEEAPLVEMLTCAFPAVRGDAAVLAMQSGTTSVPVQVLVQPTKPVEVAAEQRATFVGAYDMEFAPVPGWEHRPVGSSWQRWRESWWACSPSPSAPVTSWSST